MTDTLDEVRHKIDGAVDVDPEHGLLPRPPRGVHRPGAVRAGDEVHLRGQLDLPRPREPAPEQQRLPHHVHRPAADRDLPQQGGRAARPHQRLQPPRRDALPPQEGQPGHVHLPVPRLDVQQQRQAAEGQGPARRRLPGAVQQGGLARPARRWRASSPTAASCSAASTPTSCRWPSILGERGEDHRHDRRPVAGGPGGAARLLHLHLRRQLEAAGRERRRRLPRVARCTGTTRPPPRGAPPASRPPRRRPWTPAVGQAAGRLLRLRARPPAALDRMGATRRTGRCASRRDELVAGVRPGPRGLDDRSIRATCASTRTST